MIALGTWAGWIVGMLVLLAFGVICFMWGQDTNTRATLGIGDSMQKLIDAAVEEDGPEGKIWDQYWEGYVSGKLWDIATLVIEKKANEHVIEDMILAKLKEVESYLQAYGRPSTDG